MFIWLIVMKGGFLAPGGPWWGLLRGRHKGTGEWEGQNPDASPKRTSLPPLDPLSAFSWLRKICSSGESMGRAVNLHANRAWEPLVLSHSRSCQFLINFSRCRERCQGAALKPSSPIIYVHLIFQNGTGSGEIDGSVDKVLAAQLQIPEFKSPDPILKAKYSGIQEHISGFLVLGAWGGRGGSLGS